MNNMKMETNQHVEESSACMFAKGIGKLDDDVVY